MLTKVAGSGKRFASLNSTEMMGMDSHVGDTILHRPFSTFVGGQTISDLRANGVLGPS